MPVRSGQCSVDSSLAIEQNSGGKRTSEVFANATPEPQAVPDYAPKADCGPCRMTTGGMLDGTGMRLTTQGRAVQRIVHCKRRRATLNLPHRLSNRIALSAMHFTHTLA